MKGFQRWFVAALMLIACAAGVMAQSVPVEGDFRGTADVSSITQRLDDQQKQIDELRALIQGGNTGGGTGGNSGGETGGGGGDDTPSSGGKIGMNSGMVWRGETPDDPASGGEVYDGLLAPVCAVYRPMNWNRINDFSAEVDSIDDAHYYDGKTWRDALRDQVALCNRMSGGGADFYFNTPARATSDFVTEAVAFIRANLNEGGVIYVAYANECWLPGRFPYDHLKAVSGTDPGGGDNAFLDLWADKCDLVFAAARRADPGCVRVVETKTARDGVWFTEEITRRMTEGFDAVAGTFYFGPHHSDYVAGVTAERLLDAAEQEWQDDDRIWQEANIKWARDRGKLSIGYEAGQHYHRYGYESETRACQSHPRMIEQYKTVYGNALDKGADLIIDFNWIDWDNAHGHWGKAAKLQDVADAPKYKVVLAIAEAGRSADAAHTTRGPPAATSAVFHLTDNSARFDESAVWPGWAVTAEQNAKIMRTLGVGIVIRQPFPTRSRNPMHVDGWIQTQPRAEQWHEGYHDAMRTFADAAPQTSGSTSGGTSGGVVLYAGFPGSDRQDWPASNTGRPYADPPTLAAAWNPGSGSPPVYDNTLTEALSPYRWAAHELGARVYFDGSANIRADSYLFARLEDLRRELSPGQVGIESPPDLAVYPHLKPYAVAATWDSYRNRVEHGRWDAYTGPKLVFVQSNPPGGVHPVGETWHEVMAMRVRDVVDHGGEPALSLTRVIDAGFTDIDVWLDRYAPRGPPPPPPPE